MDCDEPLNRAFGLKLKLKLKLELKPLCAVPDGLDNAPNAVWFGPPYFVGAVPLRLPAMTEIAVEPLPQPYLNVYGDEPLNRAFGLNSDDVQNEQNALFRLCLNRRQLTLLGRGLGMAPHPLTIATIALNHQ